MQTPVFEASYFPGCSLTTSARESNEALVSACDFLGLKLIELDDWNCCGSSSAHAVDPELALNLAGRNLARAQPDRPLLIMCPSCFRNLSIAHKRFQDDKGLRRAQERKWGGEISPDLQIVTFSEILHFLKRLRGMGAIPGVEYGSKLKGMKIAPYYGCMAMYPPSMRRPLGSAKILETELEACGAEVVYWAHAHKCCGTFLSAARPDIATPLVNSIIRGAMDFGADCMVTACAMCQLNIEIRNSLDKKIPIFHFTELFALVLGATNYQGWFNRHIIDPRPLLKDRGLIA